MKNGLQILAGGIGGFVLALWFLSLAPISLLAVTRISLFLVPMLALVSIVAFSQKPKSSKAKSG